MTDALAIHITGVIVSQNLIYMLLNPFIYSKRSAIVFHVCNPAGIALTFFFMINFSLNLIAERATDSSNLRFLDFSIFTCEELKLSDLFFLEKRCFCFSSNYILPYSFRFHLFTQRYTTFSRFTL